jgi:hypothetical protein
MLKATLSLLKLISRHYLKKRSMFIYRAYTGRITKEHATHGNVQVIF